VPQEWAHLGPESTVPIQPQLRLFTLQLFLDFCTIFFPEWPLNFLVITIHQVIWSSPSTLSGTLPTFKYSNWGGGEGGAASWEGDAVHGDSLMHFWLMPSRVSCVLMCPSLLLLLLLCYVRCCWWICRRCCETPLDIWGT